MSEKSLDEEILSDKPFRGRKIALVHPAWKACGAYQVYVGQLRAWRALGAEVVAIACSDQPGFTPRRRWIWRDYVCATPELNISKREFSGAPFLRLANPKFLKNVLWPYLHGDHAAIRIGMAERSAIARATEESQYDLVHCNHYFCMPIALRLAKGAPILLDTIDVQASQYQVQNEGARWLRPHARYEDMLAVELQWMAQADVSLHLNLEEDSFFRSASPLTRHAMLYPATPSAPTGPGGEGVILVASDNRANVESVLWFLREVAPLTRAEFYIYGSVDHGIRAVDEALYEQYRDRFKGRVNNLEEVYATAKLALLPTVAGTGVSIKTVEALSSGLPLVASPLAFRGMAADFHHFPNVIIAKTARQFASAMDSCAQSPIPSADQRLNSPTRQFYETHFSQNAYMTKLQSLAKDLWRERSEKKAAS